MAGAHVLSKMDLVYIAVANNNEYGCLAVTRSNNSGDAGYYWLFTRRPPSLTPGAGSCRASESRLTYDASSPDPMTGSSGDVLLVGHFHPSSDTPLLAVYQVTTSAAGVDAVSAIDYTSGLWALNPSGSAQGPCRAPSSASP